MKNEIANLMPKELMMLVRFCNAALIILNARLFTLLGAVMSFILFGWVLWQPDWIRFAGACAFALFCFLPLQRMEARKEITGEQHEQVS